MPDCEIDCAALTEKVRKILGSREVTSAAKYCQDIEDAEYLLQLEPPVEYICVRLSDLLHLPRLALPSLPKPQVSFAQKGQDLQELIDIMDRLKVPAERRPHLGLPVSPGHKGHQNICSCRMLLHVPECFRTIVCGVVEGSSRQQ